MPGERLSYNELPSVKPPEIDIRPYDKQLTTYPIELGGLTSIGRIDLLEDDLWIVGNDQLCYGSDPNFMAFTQKMAEMMAERFRPFQVEAILAPGYKPNILAYQTARLLNSEMLIARTSIYPPAPVMYEVPIRTILSGEKNLIIDGETITVLQGKQIVLLDDVISTAGTMNGLKRLAELAGAQIQAIGAVWLEGAAPYKVLADDYLRGRLVYAGILPLFARGEVYQQLKDEEAEVMARYNSWRAGNSDGLLSDTSS